MSSRAPSGTSLRAARLGERGFTLIEFMVAMSVGAIIIAFAFLVSSNMTAGFREQNRASAAIQTVRNVSAVISADLRQAGYLVSNGFRMAAWGTPADLVPAFSVLNNADGSGPDQINVYYADASAGGRVTAIDLLATQYADVDGADGLLVGDLAVLVNGDVDIDLDGNVFGSYTACVVQITGIDDGDPDRVHFDDSAPPVNTSDNAHCADVLAAHAADGASPDTLLYRFVGRSYRIDPTRKEMSVLQASPSGRLVADDWADVAVGVTNIQAATQFYESADAALDPDGDGDPTRDWYSAEAQEFPDATLTRPTPSVAARVTLSLEARTPTKNPVQPITQSFTGEPVEYNPIGDWDGVPIAGVADASRPAAYRGDNVYRWLSEQIDMRNMAVAP